MGYGVKYDQDWKDCKGIWEKAEEVYNKKV
jgi:hypothetical protein